MKNILEGIITGYVIQKNMQVLWKTEWKLSNQNSKKKHILRNEAQLRPLWDNSKGANIHIQGSEKKGWKCIWWDYDWKLPEPKEGNSQVQEAKRPLNKMNPKTPTPRHTKIKVAKAKERMPKAAREKQSHTREVPHGFSGFFPRNCSDQEGWQDIFKVPKGEPTVWGASPSNVIIQN